MKAILAGLDDKQTQDANLTRLMANLKTISFDYVGSGAGPWEGFLTGTGETQRLNTPMKTPWGDCGTVVNLFMKVASSC